MRRSDLHSWYHHHTLCPCPTRTPLSRAAILFLPDGENCVPAAAPDTPPAVPPPHHMRPPHRIASKRCPAFPALPCSRLPSCLENRHSTCLFPACRPSQPPQPTTPLHPFWPACTATPPGSLLTPLPSQAQVWVVASSQQTLAHEALHHHCHLPCPPLSSPLKLISSWPCSRNRVAVCNTSIAAISWVPVHGARRDRGGKEQGREGTRKGQGREAAAGQ